MHKPHAEGHIRIVKAALSPEHSPSFAQAAHDVDKSLQRVFGDEEFHPYANDDASITKKRRVRLVANDRMTEIRFPDCVTN